MKKTISKSETKTAQTGKLAQILAYFKGLSLNKKLLLFIGPVGLLLYFIPGLQELGFYKVFLVVSTFLLLEFFSRRILRAILKHGNVTRLEAGILMVLMVGFIVICSLNLNLDKGLHIDELWRIDRGRQFIVFNDYDYGNFIGYPIDKTLVGFFSLFGIFEQFESIRSLDFLQKLTGGDLSAFILRLTLGVIPSSLIIWHLFPVLKKKFNAGWAWLGVFMLLLSLNFIDYSRTFLSEPLLGYLFSLIFALFVLVFAAKDQKKREHLQSLLLPLFTLTFLTKYTAIIALPVVLYVFLHGSKPLDTLKRFKESFIYSTSIFLAFLPYIFTFDGFVALAKGPVRGIFSGLRGTLIDTNLGSLIPVAVIGIILVIGLAIFFIKNFRRLYLVTSEFFTKNYNSLLIVTCIVLFILGFFETDDFITLYHYRNLAITDLAILIFSSIAVIKLLTTKENKIFNEFKFFAISSVFLLMSSAYLAVRITDVFPRHIFPYLFLLIILAIWALKQSERFKNNPSFLIKPGPFTATVLVLFIQGFLLLLTFQPNKSWQNEYWQISENTNLSIKDLATEIRSEIGPCESFVFDEAEPFWSQHMLGGIAYYYSDGDCSLRPDTAQNPFKRLKVIDFYLRKERHEQLENPYTLGLYSELVPLNASQEVENYLSDDEIIGEYMRNTDAEYLISRRDLELKNGFAYSLEEGILTDKIELDSGYFVYEIWRTQDTILEYKRLQQESVDGKNYRSSNRQMVIESWKPETRPDKHDYINLFDFVVTTAPVRIEFGAGSTYENKKFELVEFDNIER